MSFSASLLVDLGDLHLLKHPFYRAWMEGLLSPECLRNYAIQYYPHVQAFPRYVSAVHSRCSDAQARAALAHNLADEEGILGGAPHPELWLRFAEGLGASREEVISAQAGPAAQRLVDGYEEHSIASYASGLGSLFAYEHQVPEIAATKIDGLCRHYGVKGARELEFFRVHETADVYHTNACKSALDRLSEDEKAKARRAARNSAQLLWDFLTESYGQPANQQGSR